MSADESVTCWIQQLKSAPDAAPAEALWQRYYARLVKFAHQRLRDTPRRAADEEDVALSAFDSFCRRAAQGRFPRLEDRHDLWQLLLMITERKAADLVNRERRAKRGRGKVVPFSALEGPGGEADAATEGTSREPDPAFAAEVAETCRWLLDALREPRLREIAVAKMEGQTNEEIARWLGKSLATVERKLNRIRCLWENRAAQ
jgi:DNA-directed RNA polymerase specialized sigma24 family protein